MKRILFVGSAEKSAGGISSVIKTMKRMPFWTKHQCYWLGTQIQSNNAVKLWYAVKATFTTLFIIWRYDIVYFHTVPDKIGLIIQMPELLMAKLLRKKVILHIHMGNQLVYHIQNGLFKWCLTKADLIILLADRWKKLFEDKYEDIKVPTTVLYNAVEAKEMIDYSKRKKYILFAGFLDENKACNVLLKAFVKVRYIYPNWRLEILGNGDEVKYKKIAKDLELSNSITFEGYVVGDKKNKLFQEASIHCLCSYNEGFPMVVLESWAYGTPVITTPVGGLPDAVEEKKNAITFDFGDSDQLANKLIELIGNEALRKSMSKYSKEFVDNKFSTQSINMKIKHIIETI